LVFFFAFIWLNNRASNIHPNANFHPNEGAFREYIVDSRP
jgi:hypothetical protein